MPPDELEAPFPTLMMIALMLASLIAAIINGSIVMLVSALLLTPVLVWRLFLTIEDWEERRAAARNSLATTSTQTIAASTPPTINPQSTST